jgi:hypothetical protein
MSEWFHINVVSVTSFEKNLLHAILCMNKAESFAQMSCRCHECVRCHVNVQVSLVCNTLFVCLHTAESFNRMW